jgi:signal transduction histidine kinase
MVKKLFLCWPLFFSLIVSGQIKKLPVLNENKRFNTIYMDSLISIGQEHLRGVLLLPPSFVNDSIRLEAWSYLANLYRFRAGKRDSVLYFSDKMIVNGQLAKQPYFTIKGIHYQILYYQVTMTNYPKTLQLCHKALTIIEQNPWLEKESWRFQTAMGEIFIAIEQYTKALEVLKAAKKVIELTHQTTSQKFPYANILQQIGNCNKHTHRFEESEKHLLESLSIIKPTQSVGSLYYLYLDLGDLYRYNGFPEKALPYFLEAEKISQKNPTQLMNTWAWLARIYCDLKNYDSAIEFGTKALQKGASAITQRIGHHSLYRAYQAKQQWQNSLFHYEKHIAVSDTMRAKRQINESINIQNQFELDQLALRSRQAQEIESQKLVALQKQAELDRVRAQATQDALTAQTIEIELKNKLETQSLKTKAQRIQNNQVRKIKELEISELSHRLALQQRTQNFLWIGTGLLLLLLGGIFWYNRQLSFKNVQLATKNQEITEALLRGQTTERKRVAAELHDNLGGLLGALKMATNALNANSLRPQEKAIYGQIVLMIDDANAQVRSLSHNLLPKELEKHGLIPSLERLVSKLNLGSKTHFNLVISGFSQRLSPQTEVHLYAIILELCNNILKHAEATQAFIELHQQDHHSLLLVSDDGKGFDLNSDHEKGVGFQNLQERAKLLGNQLIIRSHQGEGTVISLKFNQLNHA